MNPSTVPKPRGRPPRIDRERIIAAACDLGFQAVSMRAVALRLGVTDAALYRHFANREALEEAMADVLTLDFECPPTSVHWRQWLRQLALGMRSRLLAQPGAAAVLSRIGPSSRGTVPIVETVVRELIGNGFDVRSAARAYSLITSYLIATVTRQEAVEHSAPRMAPRFTEAVEMLRPASDLLAEVAETWMTSSWEQEFEYGLDRLLDGLAIELERSRTGRNTNE